MAWDRVKLASRQRRRRDSAEARLHNEIHSHLYKLPAELLGLLYQHLSLDTSIALLFTCAKFYQSIISSNIRQQLKTNQAAHFTGLCTLEDDSVIKGYRCQGCSKRHLTTASFSQEELEKRATERYCLWTRPCLSLGTLPEMSFADVKRRAAQEKQRSSGSFSRSMILPFVSPMEQQWFLVRIYPTRETISKDQFIALCMKLNMFLCPHTRT